MKKSLLTLIFISFIVCLYAQVGPQPTPLCTDAPILCNLADIDGYQATMTSFISPSPQPTPLCPSQGNIAAQNIVWFGFVAGSDFVQLDIAVSNCTGGGGNPGVQAGIYSDCSFSEAIDCVGEGQTSDFTMSGDVVPGQTYYVFLDGNSASVCDVIIDIIQGGEDYVILNPDPDLAFEFSYGGFLDCPGPCSEVCLGGEIQFKIPIVPEGQLLDYYWTINPPTVDYPTGEIDLDAFLGVINFNELGVFEICSFGYTPCETSELSCVEFTVLPLADEVFDDYFICENEYPDAGPPGWLGPAFTGPGVYEFTVESAAYSCDYEQTINVLSIPIPIASYEMADTICINTETQINYNGTSLENGTYNWSFGGGMVHQADTDNPGPFDVTYSTTGVKYVTIEASYGGCFSEIFIDSIFVVSPLNAPLINCSSSTDSIGFSWADIANSDGFDVDVINAPPGANVTLGTNTVEVTGLNPGESVTIFVEAIDPGFCFNTSDTITCFAIDCIAPIVDVITTDESQYCIGSTSILTVNQQSLETSLEWEIMPSSGFDILSLGDSLHVNWNVANQFEVCVTAADECGESETVCKTIDVSPLEIINDTIILCKQEEIDYYGTIISEVGDYEIQDDDYCFEKYYVHVIAAEDFIQKTSNIIIIDIKDGTYSINLLEIGNFPTNYDVSIVEISSNNIINENMENGVFTFDIKNHFLDTIYLHYEVCVLERECEICVQGVLKILNKAYENLIFTNVITPNRDGINDVLRFTDEEVIPNSRIEIFNRWGDILFNTERYQNDWEPEGLPDGTYYYILSVGEDHIKRSFTILN